MLVRTAVAGAVIGALLDVLGNASILKTERPVLPTVEARRRLIHRSPTLSVSVARQSVVCLVDELVSDVNADVVALASGGAVGTSTPTDGIGQS